HERTEGNPFFIEEICRALLDQGTLTLSDGLLHSKRTIEGIALPHSIEALIRALLDQLPEAAQDLAKLASVLGRDFSRDDLEALSAHAGACGELLARLVDAALIEPTQIVPGPRYRFRHALVQFVAHESLLGRQRQVLHQRVGDMLAERHRECPDEAMDLLAYHYCQGNDAQQAIDCSLRAARLAAQRAAHSVAVQHLNNAIGLLEEQPPGPCRNPQLLDAYAVLGHYLILLQGYRSEGVTRVYERAKALNADDTFGDARFSLAWMLWRYTYVRARLAEGAALAEQLQAMAGRSGNPGKRLAAHAAAGIIALLRGDATRALGCFDVALTNFDAQTELLLAREYGDSPAVFAWTFRGMALTLLGRLDAADGSFQSARELADTLAHPGSRTLALYYSGVFWAALGMLDKVARSSQALVELCERHDFIGIRALGMVQQGMVMLAQGGVHAEKGMAMIQAGADTAIASGSDLFRPVHHLFMAEQLARAGQPDAARAHLLQAREALQSIGPHHNDSELERIQGVLAADQDPAGALRHFERAMALTQARRAPLLGLRCAMDAATLLMSQQRLAAAQGWLQPALEGLSSQAHWPPVARAVALLEKLTNAERPGR
ncbi:hypothetical protein, partial [Ideonella sp.]|uniref:ATP-binding protein n=1 Tax=Ideonella sp. TaxID=1929293 RepID=UPI002B4A6DF3